MTNVLETSSPDPKDVKRYLGEFLVSNAFVAVEFPLALFAMDFSIKVRKWQLSEEEILLLKRLLI